MAVPEYVNSVGVPLAVDVREPVVVLVAVHVAVAVPDPDAVGHAVGERVELLVDVREDVREAEPVRVGVPLDAADTVVEKEGVPDTVDVRVPDEV